MAILTLSVGIGVNTVAFNAVNALVLKPFRMDYADPVSLQTAAGARQAWSSAVSANYLTTVEAHAEIGRLLSPSDLAGSDLPSSPSLSLPVRCRLTSDEGGPDRGASR